MTDAPYGGLPPTDRPLGEVQPEGSTYSDGLGSTTATDNGTAGTAREQAGQVGQTAKDSGQRVAGTATEQGKNVLHESKQQARNLAHQVTQQVHEQSSVQKDKASGSLRGLERRAARLDRRRRAAAGRGHRPRAAGRHQGRRAGRLARPARAGHSRRGAARAGPPQAGHLPARRPRSRSRGRAADPRRRRRRAVRRHRLGTAGTPGTTHPAGRLPVDADYQLGTDTTIGLPDETVGSTTRPTTPTPRSAVTGERRVRRRHRHVAAHLDRSAGGLRPVGG